MIEQRATITRVEDRYAWIEAERETSCGQCSAQKGCGTGLLAKTVGKRFVQMKVLNPIEAQAGDSVIVGLPEAAFLKSAFLTYLLPLLLMLAGAITTDVLFADASPAGQLLVGAGGVLGFVLGWLILRRHVRAVETRQLNQPVVLRILRPNISSKSVHSSIINTTF